MKCEKDRKRRRNTTAMFDPHPHPQGDKKIENQDADPEIRGKSHASRRYHFELWDILFSGSLVVVSSFNGGEDVVK